jgi:hypothetical protein
VPVAVATAAVLIRPAFVLLYSLDERGPPPEEGVEAGT